MFEVSLSIKFNPGKFALEYKYDSHNLWVRVHYCLSAVILVLEIHFIINREKVTQLNSVSEPNLIEYDILDVINRHDADKETSFTFKNFNMMSTNDDIIIA